MKNELLQCAENYLNLIDTQYKIVVGRKGQKKTQEKQGDYAFSFDKSAVREYDIPKTDAKMRERLQLWKTSLITTAGLRPSRT